jgi:hypothetical protein
MSISDAVENYMLDQKSDYAFMITGAWGTGKTFYWKHILEQQIRRAQGSHADRAKIIYVSLYGKKSTEQIIAAIVWKFAAVSIGLPVDTKNKWWQFGSILSKTFPKGIIEKYTGLNIAARNIEVETLTQILATRSSRQHLVFCLDDLERTKIPIGEILGFINQIVEHSDAKVFLICNEEQLINNSEYRKSKEKLVRITRQIPEPCGSIIETVIGGNFRTGPAGDFLNSQMMLVKDLFLRSEGANLRHLKYGISSLQTAITSLLELGETPDERCVRTVLPLSIDFHAARLTREQVESVIRELPQGLYSITREASDISPEGFHYLRYHPEPYRVKLLRYPSLVNAITENAINKEDLRLDIKAQQLLESQGEHPLKRWGDTSVMENDEFEKLCEASLTAITLGDFPDIDTIVFSITAMAVAIEDGYFSKSISQLQQDLEKGLANCSLFPLPAAILDTSFRKHKRGGNLPILDWLEKQLRERNNTYRLKHIKNMIELKAKSFATHPGDFCIYLNDEENGAGAFPISELIESNQLIEILRSATNFGIAYLEGALKIRSEKPEFMAADKRLIKELSEWLQKDAIPTAHGVRQFRLNALAKEMAEFFRDNK